MWKMALIGLCIVLSGCATGYLEVNSIGAAAGKTYILEPANKGATINDLEWKEYSQLIHNMLRGIGYVPVDEKSADIIIGVLYYVGEPQVTYESSTKEIAGFLVTDTAEKRLYPTSLSLAAADLKKYRETKEVVPLWKTTISGRAEISDLRVTLPDLINSIAPYIGTNTGKSIKILPYSAIGEKRSIQ